MQVEGSWEAAADGAMLWLGAACTVVGLVGQVVSFWPPKWRSPDWEVAYFGEFSATSAVLVIGAALLVAGWIRVGRGGLAALVGVGFVGLACWGFFGGALVALDLPLVERAATVAGTVEQRTGLRTIGLKAVLLCVVYGIGALWVGVLALSARGLPKREKGLVAGIRR